MDIMSSQDWYIVKSDDGYCHIMPATDMPPKATTLEQWGPYPTLPEAMARRVGLIRSHHCRPN